MHFNKFVQVGRVAVIAIGPQEGKLCVILDIIDQNRALIEGPFHGVVRQAINFKVLHLTKFCLRIPHSARQATVKKQWIKAEIDKKWSETQWAKKQAAKALRTNMSDFERFKVMKAKQARNRVINLEFGKLRLKARKAKTSAKPAAKNVVKKK